MPPPSRFGVKIQRLTQKSCYIYLISCACQIFIQWERLDENGRGLGLARSHINNTKAICSRVLLKGGSFQSIRVAADWCYTGDNLYRRACVISFAFSPRLENFTTQGIQTRIERFYLISRCSYFLIFVYTSLVFTLHLHFTPPLKSV